MYIYENVSFGRDGLTGKQTNEAKNIALSNNLVAFFLGEPNATYEFGNIRRPGPDYFIDTNASLSLAVVPINLTNDYVKANLSVTVDLDEKKVISVYFDEQYPDITYRQQMDAIKIALEDDNVRGWMQDALAANAENNQSLYYDGYVIEGVHQSGFGEYGYVDPFGFYVDVPMRIDSPMPMAVKYLVVTVNLGDNTVAIRKESLGEALMGSVVTATIPPGQSFYRAYNFPPPFHPRTISNGFELGDSNYIKVDQHPDDLYLYPFVVDRENLYRLKNGSRYSEISWVRYGTQGNKWYVYMGNGDYYLVLKNLDDRRAANVTLPYRAF